jgi:hypothetical protein
MRLKLAVCMGVVVALACGSINWAFAGDVYSSIDGSLKAARLTQSETEFEQADQVFNVASWNNTALGAEWAISCNLQTADPDVVVGLDRFGNGVVITTNVFRGGAFHLYRAGPWGDTHGEVFGRLLTNQVVLTEYYQAGQVVRADMVSVALGVARFGKMVEFKFSSCTAWGECEGPMKEYPELLDQECSPTRVLGYWADMADVRIEVSKPVTWIPRSASPANADAPATVGPATWGAMKIRYR